MNEEQLLLKKAISYAIKSASSTILDVDMTKRIVVGMYNSYNFFDSGNDVLLPGCCAKSISERGPAGTAVQKIKHLMGHDWKLLPGRIQVLEEKEVDGVQGLCFETKMANTTLGNDTLINYQEKVYDNHSIGFQYINGKYVEAGSDQWTKYLSLLLNPKAAEERGYMYVWDEIKLYEGSTVAFGENSLTPYLGVKSLNKEALAMKVNERIDLLGQQLKSGTQSDDAMHLFEMERLQLKQLINEIFTLEPSVKDTLTKSRQEKDTTQKTSGISFSSLSNSLKN